MEANHLNFIILVMSAFTNTLSASSYLPTYALLVSRELGEPETNIGWLMGLFACACLVGFAVLPLLASRISSRTILACGLLMRVASGAFDGVCPGVLQTIQGNTLWISCRLLEGFYMVKRLLCNLCNT